MTFLNIAPLYLLTHFVTTNCLDNNNVSFSFFWLAFQRWSFPWNCLSFYLQSFWKEQRLSVLVAPEGMTRGHFCNSQWLVCHLLQFCGLNPGAWLCSLGWSGTDSSVPAWVSWVLVVSRLYLAQLAEVIMGQHFTSGYMRASCWRGSLISLRSVPEQTSGFLVKHTCYEWDKDFLTDISVCLWMIFYVFSTHLSQKHFPYLLQ